MLRTAVYDRDALYGTRLCAFLARNAAECTPVQAFTDEEELKNALGPSRNVLLIVAERDLRASLLASVKGPLLLLADGSANPLAADLPRTEKYQSAFGIIRAVLLRFAAEPSLSLVPGGNTRPRLVGVGGPDSSPPGTIFALSAAQLLAKKEPLLYLTLDPLPSLARLYPGEGASLSELLYHLEGSGDPASVLADVPVLTPGLSFLPAVRDPLDLAGLPGEGLAELLRFLGSCRLFGGYVIDLGPFALLSCPALRLLDRLFVPSQPGAAAKERHTRFSAMLEGAGLPKDAVFYAELPRDVPDGEIRPEQLPLTPQGRAAAALLGRDGTR